MAKQPLVQVKVLSREKTLYDGPALSVLSENEKGVFSILPYHANFITLLKDKVVVTDANGKKNEYPVNNGVLRVENNKVEVFIGIKIPV